MGTDVTVGYGDLEIEASDAAENTLDSRRVCSNVVMTIRMFTLVAGVVVVAGCSFSTGTSPERAGETLIEGPIGEQVGLTFVDAECAKPADRDVGTTFTCTATAPSGETATFDGISA